MTPLIERADRKLPLRYTRDEWYILSVPWESVPNYDFAAACKGMDDSAIQREILRNWSVTPGKAVYPQYSERLHLAEGPLPYDPSRPLHIGWDWAWTGCPACVVTQLNHYGQWLVLSEIAPNEAEATEPYSFAERVASHLLRVYANPNDMDLDDLEMVHIGDPAGVNPPVRAREGRKQEVHSCFEILKKGSKLYLGNDDHGNPAYEEKPGWGWNVIKGKGGKTDRIQAVTARLTTTLPGGHTAFLVDPRCEAVRNALGGGYAYKQFSDGTYGHDPEKNLASHIADALAYVATRLDARPARKWEQDDDEVPAGGLGSMASGNWRR
jgi:hypothetical protein